MAFNPSTIKHGPERNPRKVLIHGAHKLGKSTLAASAKNAILIPTEDRVSHIDCDKTDVITSYEDLLDIFEWLITSKSTYKRIVIDTIDWLEPMLHEWWSKRIDAPSLTDNKHELTSFSRGLKFEAPKAWRHFLDNCDIMRSKGFDIIFVAHSQTLTVKPTTNDDYDKEVIKIHKDSVGVIEEWVDVLSFYAKDIYVDTERATANGKGGKAKSLNTRTLYLCDNPAFTSGNSYGLHDITVNLEQCQEIMEYMLTENNNVAKVKKIATKKGE